MTKNKNSEREQIKLEIAGTISENDLFVNKIKHYRSIVKNIILAGCTGYRAWVDASKDHVFIVIGTETDVVSWRDRHDAAIAPVPPNADAHEIADVAITDIMSHKLLEYIDEEIYSIYNNRRTSLGFQFSRYVTLKTNFDSVVVGYITSHIFWASPCAVQGTFLYPDHPWIRDWCKGPPKKENTPISKMEDKAMQDPEEEEADLCLVEAALIAKTNPDSMEKIQKALDKLFVAVNIYNSQGNPRKRAMASVLIVELYAKTGQTEFIKIYLDYAMNHLDQKLDQELIKHCKMILGAMDKVQEKAQDYATIQPPSAAGTVYNGFSATTDYNSNKFNKPHILVTKPPIVVPMDYDAKTAKKRPEARKPKKPKTAPPPAEETNVDFIKAAVAGKLFNDDNDT